MKVAQALKTATEKLKALNLERPQVEAQLLIAKVLKIERSQISAHDQNEISQTQMKELEALIARRLAFEPMAYLRGEKEFFGLTFEVNSNVLIPRPETEGLVEGVLDWIKQVHRIDGLIVDIGTGSGAIPIALSKMLPENFQFVGVDISRAALEVAERNSIRHGYKNIRWLEADIFDPTTELMAALKHAVVLISNPPYIPTGEISKLIPDIARYEPTIALDGGDDGLKYFKEILRWIPEKTPNLRFLAFETHLPEQAQTISGLIASDALVSSRGPVLCVEFN